jgi:hypothetical protein
MESWEKPAGFILLELGFVLFLVVALVRLVRDAGADLRFYWRNGWDFSKDSGRSLSYGYAGAIGGPVPNKLRLFVGYPFLIIGISSALVLIDYKWF